MERKPDDLRERLLDRRREGESHHDRERHKRERRQVQHQLQQLEQRHQQLDQQQRQHQALQEEVLPPRTKETPQERAEREERESRRLKLLEAGRNINHEFYRYLNHVPTATLIITFFF